MILSMQHKEETAANQFQSFAFTPLKTDKNIFKNRTSEKVFNAFFSVGYLSNIIQFLLEAHAQPMNNIIHTYYSD